MYPLISILDNSTICCNTSCISARFYAIHSVLGWVCSAHSVLGFTFDISASSLRHKAHSPPNPFKVYDGRRDDFISAPIGTVSWNDHVICLPLNVNVLSFVMTSNLCSLQIYFFDLHLGLPTTQSITSSCNKIFFSLLTTDCNVGFASKSTGYCGTHLNFKYGWLTLFFKHFAHWTLTLFLAVFTSSILALFLANVFTWRLIRASDSFFGASGSALKLWRVARLLNRTKFSWPQESPIWFQVSFLLGTQLSNLAAGNW